jgi:hypothetical protein
MFLSQSLLSLPDPQHFNEGPVNTPVGKACAVNLRDHSAPLHLLQTTGKVDSEPADSVDTQKLRPTSKVRVGFSAGYKSRPAGRSPNVVLSAKKLL